MPNIKYSFTVKYGCTENVGDYSNVRPELEISFSGDGPVDEALGYMDRMSEEIQARVHAIVDDEREAHGQRIRYSKQPTFTLLDPPDFDFLALVPTHEQLPENWTIATKHSYQGLRYETMLDKLKNDPDYFARIDQLEMFSVAQLPCLERFTFLEIHHPSLGEMLILASGNISTRYDLSRCPGPLAPRWYDYIHNHSGTCVIMPREIFLKKMRELALEKGFSIYYCFDNDFSFLPELPI